MNLTIGEIGIPQLGRKRTLRVLLPPGYNENPDSRYPVLYMQDGHNLFDPAAATYGSHWRIAETLEKLYAEQACPEIIVVGVDCNQEGFKRLDEYSPWKNREAPKKLTRFFGKPVDSVGGEGEAYAAFLADTLKPYIDMTYRTKSGRESTCIAGSSMGGLISLYAAYRRPDLYSRVGAFSTALWFARDELFAFVRERFTKELTVYLDIGTDETSDETVAEFPAVYLKQTQELGALLLELGQSPDKLKLVVEAGAVHSETSWARRFPEFIRWIFA